MTQDLIRYDLLAQEALRGVVRRVLTDVARNGLPGEHHFFIAFDTRAPGVRISQRLHEKHPEEMTVVLQHQFWDLVVTDQSFEVGLSFGNVPEKLLVPFDAIKGFFDPSVQFGLQFEVAREGEDAGTESEAGARQDNMQGANEGGNPEARPSAPGAGTKPGEAEPGRPAAEGSEDEAEGAARGEVVSLDAFRKKT